MEKNEIIRIRELQKEFFLSARTLDVSYRISALKTLKSSIKRHEDELFEALTLVQTHKVTSFPIVLFGTEYWSGLVDWLRTSAVGAGTIAPGDVDRMHLTDDVVEAADFIQSFGTECPAPAVPPA